MRYLEEPRLFLTFCRKICRLKQPLIFCLFDPWFGESRGLNICLNILLTELKNFIQFSYVNSITA